MIVREQKHTKKNTGIVVSVSLHLILLLLLFLVLTEKKLTPLFLPTPTSEKTEQRRAPDPQRQNSAPQKMDNPAQKPTLDQPFVVPAPVVFYGNQAMMNNPVPVSGHADGKSAFEHTPSALPTPPAHAIAPERTVPVISELMGEKAEIAHTEEMHDGIAMLQPEEQSAQEASISPEEEIPSQEVTTAPSTALASLAEATMHIPSKSKSSSADASTTKDQQLPTKKQKTGTAKKLTLADLFKNSQQTIASFAQDGLPSARKAGTEGGDDLGSGHQITIKEGDMRYYTLWAGFLNHLNASARFSRRGKEHLIEQWIRTGRIQYVLQCGITIDMQGNVIDVDLVISSGSKDFDNMCLNDIYTAAPYPPLPERLGKKTARFEVSVHP